MEEVSTNKSYPSTFRYVINQGEFSFNTTSAYDWVTQTKAINLTAESIKEITCPVFTGAGQNDTSFPGQAATVAPWLGDRAYYHLFLNSLGAGQRCQVGAEYQLAAVSLSWLDGVFSNATKALNGAILH
jgi:hypothetical protein